MKNLTLFNVAASCNGKLFCNEEQKQMEVFSVETDSRKVVKDSLFIAIKGERVDGHDFINQVYEKGALCVVSEKILNTHKPYIYVENSLQAIKDIAQFYREGLKLKVVGITGSVGKTSTKEMIHSVLSQKYNVLKTEGNFNNELGLPLTVFRLREEHEIAVLEMGISDFGEMTRLSKIAKPDVAVITNIGLCHLENLKTRDGILKAKTEMFNNLAVDGNIVLNGDDDKLVTISKYNSIVPQRYFVNPQNTTNASIYADNVLPLGIEGIKADFHIDQDVFTATIHIPGEHMVYNALCAICVGKIFNLSIEQIKNGIENLKPVSGRNNIINVNNKTIIDDCYNANPVSMKASIDVLSYSNTRKVAILGDMFELGTNEGALHASIGTYLLKKNIDVVILIGNLMKNAYIEMNGKNENKLFYFENIDDTLAELENIVSDNDTILIKASHAMKFTRIIKKLSNTGE